MVAYDMQIQPWGTVFPVSVCWCTMVSVFGGLCTGFILSFVFAVGAWGGGFFWDSKQVDECHG